MKSILLITLVLLFIICCNHPESKKYERNQGNDKGSYKNKQDANSIYEFEDDEKSSNNTIENNSVKMEIESGVRFVWIEINGLKLRFIFDTGASNICISSAEATVLYRQGTLREDDILNIEYFQDATGRISEGTTINLREVKIGDMVIKNVTALVIDNVDAPLLLGQTVLERFGNIEIDNINQEIIFR